MKAFFGIGWLATVVASLWLCVLVIRYFVGWGTAAEVGVFAAWYYLCDTALNIVAGLVAED